MDFLMKPEYSISLGLWYSPCSLVQARLPAFMTRRIGAWLLFVLAASPVTAPFSTCDLATLFGHITGLVATSADTPGVQRAPHDLSPIANDAVLADSWFDSTTGRIKPLAIAPYSLQPRSTTHRPSGAGSGVLNPMRLPDGQPVAATGLRV